MPATLLKFRNYTAACRKRNMQNFGMYMIQAAQDLVVIEDSGSLGGFVGIVDTGDHQNFTLSISPFFDDFVLVRAGVVQQFLRDYTLAGPLLTLTVPLDPSDPLDYIQGFTIGMMGDTSAGGGGGGGGSNFPNRQTFTAAGGQTNFVPSFAITNLCMVLVNGQVMTLGVDYTLPPGNFVQLTVPSIAGDVVQIWQ